MEIIGYVFIIAIACIGVYAAGRAIEHHFYMKEMEAEKVYDAGLMDQKISGIQWLSEDLIKKFNDSVKEMYSGLLGDKEA